MRRTHNAAVLAWRFPAAIAVVAAAVTSATAQAQSGVDWRAPAGCPTGAEFTAMLSSESSTAGAFGRGKLRAVVTVTGEPGPTWAVRIQVRGPGQVVGDRTLEGASCAEVASAAALYLAMVAGATPDEPPPPADHVPPAVGARDLQVSLSGGAASDHGSLPRTTLGGFARIALVGRRWSAEVGYTRWDGRRKRLDQDRRFGGDFSLWTAGAAGCSGIWRPMWLCVGAESGALSAVGLGSYEPREPSELWWAGTAGTRLRWEPLTHLALTAAVELAVPLQRKRFEVGGLGTVHRPDPVLLRAAISADITFSLTDPP